MAHQTSILGVSSELWASQIWTLESLSRALGVPKFNLEVLKMLLGAPRIRSWALGHPKSHVLVLKGLSASPEFDLERFERALGVPEFDLERLNRALGVPRSDLEKLKRTFGVPHFDLEGAQEGSWRPKIRS